MAKKDITHGMSHTKIYRTWCGMKSRCYTSSTTGYPYYGALGIKVCNSWKDSFENFYQDMGDIPKDMSLDRIDSMKDYSPENCRWADLKTQKINRHKRKKTKSKYKGVHIRDKRKITKYEAYITVNKKRIHLGTHLLEQDAAMAYNKAAIQYHGKEAKLNQVGEY